jgi:CheY-like chemotaxis protein
VSANRILVVEDNRDNMTLIVDVLDSLEYDVIKATDGEQGVSLATREQPDLILMDLSLPLKDGWTATREIKSNDAGQKIPVIALTAHAMAGDREKALAAGCDDYLTKPIDLLQLDQLLKKYLG